MTEAEQQAYNRGHDAGGISERLAGHDRHFESINGQLKRLADGQEAGNLELRELRLQAKAAADTVIATAKALKEADEARRLADDQKWTPATRLYMVLGIIAAIVGLLAYLR